MAQPKSHYANANTLVEKQEQAMEEARRQLAKEGNACLCRAREPLNRGDYA